MLRIISGTAKNIRLEVPLKGTRPMMDRPKTALFSILGSIVQDAKVLDVYAGSGALGIECLSRNAKHVTFIDISEFAAECIFKNLKKCGFSKPQFEIIKNNALTVLLKKAHDNQRVSSGKMDKDAELYNIIFVCPPYIDLNEESVRLSGKLLAPYGVIVAEVPTDKNLPEEIDQLIKVDERVYGRLKLFFFQKKSDTIK